MLLQTEFGFTLPKGFVSEDGTIYRNGVMRLSSAADEILPLKDPRVQNNPSYITIIVLARVIIKLGDLNDINPGIIEKLFIEDLGYLQEFYRKINGDGNINLSTKCQHCGEMVELSFNPPGE